MPRVDLPGACSSIEGSPQDACAILGASTFAQPPTARRRLPSRGRDAVEGAGGDEDGTQRQIVRLWCVEVVLCQSLAGRCEDLDLKMDDGR